MKKLLVISSFLIGCGAPTPENDCCTGNECTAFTYRSQARCLYEVKKDLEKRIEILELKMHYECKQED